jgi:hypothetical protein
MIDRPSGARAVALACFIAAAIVVGERSVSAQGRDGLLNGAIIGGAVGAGAGVAFTHAVRDSDLTFGQYMRGALIFGAIGAGAGIGVDALFNRASSVPGTARPGTKGPRVFVAPAVWRGLKGVVVRWSW